MDQNPTKLFPVHEILTHANYCVGISFVPCKQSREFDKQKLSSVHCVVDYKNVNDLDKFVQ